jgi:hypothetical protein
MLHRQSRQFSELAAATKTLAQTVDRLLMLIEESRATRSAHGQLSRTLGLSLPPAHVVSSLS